MGRAAALPLIAAAAGPSRAGLLDGVLSAAEFRSAADSAQADWARPGAGEVPRVLHQTWKDAQILPQHRAPFRSWGRCLNGSGWRRVFWTDRDAEGLVAEAAPDFLSVYRAFPHPVQRADSFRYVLLRRYGGLYADVDYECSLPPDLSQAARPAGSSRCGVYLAQQPRKALDGALDRSRYSALAGRYGIALDLGAPEPDPFRWPVMNSLMASLPGAQFWDRVLAETTRRAADPTLPLGIFGRAISQSTGVTMLTEAFFAALAQQGTRGAGAVCVFGVAAWNGEDGIGGDRTRFAVHRSTAVWRMETVVSHVASRVRWAAAALYLAAAAALARSCRDGAGPLAARLAVLAAAAWAAQWAALGAAGALYRLLRRTNAHDLAYEYAASAAALAAVGGALLAAVRHFRRRDAGAGRRDG
eukprot:TRINITY_DN11400_c0_g1_i1.p1 TRINITY_DN11400_c0_g1~~TRINITY_DN11400_c0_g1_i1.p1  ORF type:complete len:438 (+),score=127.06 TRINITY_DN11400_c0_g1_i1:71-1315(+)